MNNEMRRLILITEKALSGDLQTSQTETPAFRRWFGASKVVDAHGKPMVMYHATTSNFLAFSPDCHFGTQAQAHQILDLRRNESNQHLIPVYLRVENPKRVEDAGGHHVNWARQVETARAEGHDGLVYQNWGEFDADEHGNPRDSYVVFSPNQIKSAVGNAGVFDPNNANITEGGQMKPKFGIMKELALESSQAPMTGLLTVYRGEYSGNKGGNFWTMDKQFAVQFTQTGREQEVLKRYIWAGEIYQKSRDVYAGNEAGVDAALEAARADGYKAIMLSEGPGEPFSIFVFDKSALHRTPPRL